MPKKKTHKGAAKRFKITGSGKVKRNRAGARHLLSTKTGNRKRKLRSAATVAKSETKTIIRLISH